MVVLERHADRPAYAFGLCRACYDAKRYRDNPQAVIDRVGRWLDRTSPLHRKATAWASNAKKQQVKQGVVPVRHVPAAVFERISQLACVSCGLQPAGGLDHRLAFVNGGTHVEDNLQPMCNPCNRRKQDNGEKRGRRSRNEEG